jgi:hypothetical protein
MPKIAIAASFRCNSNPEWRRDAGTGSQLGFRMAHCSAVRACYYDNSSWHIEAARLRATTGRSMQCSRFSFEKAVFLLIGSNFTFMGSLALRISRLLREHCLTSKLPEVSCQSQRSHLGPSRSPAALLSPMRKRVCQKLSIGDSVLIGMRPHPSDTARGRGNASSPKGSQT